MTWAIYLQWSLFCIFLLQSGHFSEDMIPTVGFNMRKVTKGNVTIKVCDDVCRSIIFNIRVLLCLGGPVPGFLMNVWRPLPSDMGHRWTASVQKHVGALLSRGQCYRVSLWANRWPCSQWMWSHKAPAPVLKWHRQTFRRSLLTSPTLLQLHGGCSRQGEDRSFKKWTPQSFRKTAVTRNSSKIFLQKRDFSAALGPSPRCDRYSEFGHLKPRD